jgi:hypothetical protein
MNGNIAYNFLRMNSNRKLNWNLHGSMSAINNSEKYYYIPEIFTSSWFNLIGKVGIQKNIYSGNFHFAPSVDISYNSNLSNSILLSTLPEIAKNQRPETYLQEFDYYTADVLDIKGMLQIGFTPRLVKIGQINVGVTGDYMKPADMDLHNTFFNVTVGFVF